MFKITSRKDIIQYELEDEDGVLYHVEYLTFYGRQSVRGTMQYQHNLGKTSIPTPLLNMIKDYIEQVDDH